MVGRWSLKSTPTQSPTHRRKLAVLVDRPLPVDSEMRKSRFDLFQMMIGAQPPSQIHQIPDHLTYDNAHMYYDLFLLPLNYLNLPSAKQWLRHSFYRLRQTAQAEWYR